MRHFTQVFAAAILLLTGLQAKAQNVLEQDGNGAYNISLTASAPGTSKAELYERMRPFVTQTLQQPDANMPVDADGLDSLLIPMSIMLGSNSVTRNQMLDCNARLYFRDGEARLVLSQLVWSGRDAGSQIPAHYPLNQLGHLVISSQLWAMGAADDQLQLLATQMNAYAAGIIENTVASDMAVSFRTQR